MHFFIDKHQLDDVLYKQIQRKQVIALIYFTGDLHGDPERVSRSALNMLSAGDTLIVCGDFGFIWDNNKNEQKILANLSKRNYNICFIDGTHENFDILNSLPIASWNGGKAHKISNNIYHLMRGQVFTIEGKRIFTMGGGENPEMDLQEEEDISSHKEIPTSQEMLSGVANLESCEYEVDYIVTHEPPAKTRDFLLLSANKTLRVTALGAYLDELAQQADHKRWFFGSMHIDRFISGTQVALFRNIVNGDTYSRPGKN